MLVPKRTYSQRATASRTNNSSSGTQKIPNSLAASLFFLVDDHNKNGEPETPIKIAEVKEKFAGLRVYCHYEDDYVEGLVRFSEAISYKTCEHCGSPGKREKPSGYYIKTVCSDCMESNYGVKKELDKSEGE